jgi:long-chain acyl-CoA synthetase
MTEPTGTTDRAEPATLADSIRRERHFGGRIVRCFAHRPASLLDLLDAAAIGNPDGEAIVAGDRRITYRDLSGMVDRAAAGLAAAGVVAGDRVAIVLRNRPEFMITVLAAIRLGAIAVPVNVREGPEELGYVLRHAGARVLVHEAEARLPDAAVPGLTHRFVCGGEANGAAPFEALLTGPDVSLAPPAGDEEATAVLLYTSGTTGRPKGAMLSHLNLVHSALHYQHGLGLGPGERSLLAVPASHVTGLVAVIAAMLRVGGAVVMMEAFDAARFAALAAAERITHAVMVPAMYNLLLLRVDLAAHDLSAWRVGGYGGAPMPVATIDALAAALPGLQLSNLYGATETTSPATMTPFAHARAKADCVGLPAPCAEIALMDEDGREVPDGEDGEIWISGPMVVAGYWADPAATAAAFPGGWWRSGDVGALDADGFLQLRDRKKDLINRGGYKIYSAEIENTLAWHPDVAEVAAVPRPDPVLGERVHCFVVTKSGGLDEASLKAFCAERLADYKVPDGFTLTEGTLPRNANGKVLKRVLAAELAREGG